ncbi:870c33a3-8a3e-4fdb-8ef5-3dc2434eceeb [Sclerotinia trifoliorum]|uniref:870c33a3-8a3e-4fdb-8ef5-3dc2434eceeb n=1 Tax=Sclerotinia trifoliorum TaxID=28548 RepID=A0A8H2W097_9HELO|nr:870c33a3-8a3e-4fdb-8ef5-3dc2434eceeb [Sclerotinia trifoliorum]
MARTSARSTSQDIPSSPPKRESPIRRVTRSTRHQSVDLDESRNNGGSVERADSEEEQRIPKGARRVGVARRSDLSILEEDSEVSPEEDEEVEEEDEDEDEIEEDPEATKVADFQVYDLEHGDRSNLSGETLNTSHTVRVMQAIDSISAIETLPDLYDTACKIINKSTKKDVRPKEMGRHLRSLKTLFDTLEVNKEPYGGEQFIEVDIVKQKLSGSIDSVDHSSEGLGDKAIPVTAILQSANLATLVGQVNQLRKDVQAPEEELKVFLQSLDKTFPRPFVSEFAEPLDEDSEDSKLINKTFDMVLDIRTQLFITASHQLETDPAFDPDHLLRSYFLDSADGGEICGVDFKVIGLKGQSERTDERIDLIRDTFMPADEATGPGEYIDFGRLEVLFPRSEFFNNLVGYSQDRLAEVEKIVDSRGGIENVMEPLKDLVKDLASDGEPSINVDYKQDVVDRDDSSISKTKASPPPRKPRKEPHADLKAISKLMKFRSQGDRVGPSRPDSSTNAKSNIRGPSRIQSEGQQEESEITRNFKKFTSSQDKENRRPDQHQGSRGATVPADTSRRAMYRKHPNGERVEWNEDSQGFLIDSQPRNNKRKGPLPPDDEADSSDQGFQSDQRAAEPTARQRRVRVDDEVLHQPINHKRKASSPPAAQPNGKGVSSERNNKRKASSSPAVEPEDEDHSSDQGFQNHQRLSRPMARPTKRARTEAGESSRAQNSRGGNRSREVHSPLVVDDNDDVDEVHNQFALVRQDQRRREKSRSYQVRRMSPGRSRGRSVTNQDDDEGSLRLPADEYSDETSFPFTQATARANARVQAAKTGFNKAQTRTEWSDGDTQLLIDYISGIGPMWAEIERRGEFERANISQVGLKDKARNIKVSMLLAGQKLPRNFEGVKLNVNLIKRIKTTWPNYDPYTETGYGAF